MKVLPSLMPKLGQSMRAEAAHPRTSRSHARSPHTPHGGPDRSASRQRLRQMMEAARVLEDPDSSEEDQQFARESMREALRAMLADR